MPKVDRSAIERQFFRTLNRVVEPMVRAGLGSPRIAPGGLIVLETTGRKSGRRFRTPLAATRIGDYVLVATARGSRSQWVPNASARPSVRFPRLCARPGLVEFRTTTGIWPDCVGEVPYDFEAECAKVRDVPKDDFGP